MKRLLSATVLAASLLGGGTALAATHPHRDLPNWVTAECHTEWQVNCRWTAWDHGNGRGHTYIVRQVPGSTGMVCVFYVEPRYAAHHDYCS